MIVSAIATIALGSMLQKPYKPLSETNPAEFERRRQAAYKLVNPGLDYKPLLAPKLDFEMKIISVQRIPDEKKVITLAQTHMEFSYQTNVPLPIVAKMVTKQLIDDGWRKIPADEFEVKLQREHATGPLIWQRITIGVDMREYIRKGKAANAAPTSVIYDEKVRD